jgi:hypothetical protein
LSRKQFADADGFGAAFERDDVGLGKYLPQAISGPDWLAMDYHQAAGEIQNPILGHASVRIEDRLAGEVEGGGCVGDFNHQQEFVAARTSSRVKRLRGSASAVSKGGNDAADMCVPPVRIIAQLRRYGFRDTGEGWSRFRRGCTVAWVAAGGLPIRRRLDNLPHKGFDKQ